MNLDRKVAKRYLRKIAIEAPASPVSGPPEKEILPTRLVDLINLAVAFDAYLTWLEQQGTDLDSLAQQGTVLVRRFLPSLQLGVTQHFAPIMERPEASILRTKWQRAQLPGTPPDIARRLASYFQMLLPWLKIHHGVFQDIFSGRSAKTIRDLVVVVQEENPAACLNKAAALAPISGLTMPRKWIEEAAQAAGAPLTAGEAAITDGQTAQNLGEDLQTVESKIGVVTQGTPEAAALQEERTNLVAQIHQVAQESASPSVVLATATSATRTTPRSGVIQRFGLTDEQAEVVQAMGKVLVAAGAGSGKTQTIVATIASLVEEKGYAPAQILTCSFTRAASAELGSRLDAAGVGGVDSGTTHHVARGIIERNRPNLVPAMRNTRGADKCFKMAMIQVQMDVAGFQRQMEEGKAVLQRIESIPGWRSIEILKSFHDQVGRGRSLSEKQLAVLPKFERGGGSGGWGGGSRRPYRRWAAEEEDSGGADRRSKYWSAPIGEWFNLGKPLLDEKGGKMGPKRALLAVDNYKNSGIGVDQARATNGDTPIVALYAAYEWLKKNDPVFGPAMDYTDQLQISLEILETDPAARAAEQGRYRCILVDEAQDLNETQFKMFQLLGKSADLLSFIGDDRQSIYGFRGARPQNYTALSKDPAFQTKLMTTNFRSGKAIVDAAEKLIAYNEDRQVPKVCRSHDRRGVGSIRAKDPLTHEEGAATVAQEIADAVAAGESPADFGVLVRNNAEADAYNLALIARGIPYRTLKKEQGGYFGKPVVKALTAWLRLIVGGSDAEINDAVIEAHQTPGFGLDKQFATYLGRQVRGSNYLDWISAAKPVYQGPAAWMDKRVAEYMNTIRQVRLQGQGDSSALIQAILGLRGNKSTFIETLMKFVDEDDVIEDEGEEAGEEAIRNAALAPVRPLMTMAENFPDPANMLLFIAKMKGANEKAQKKTPQDKEDWKEPAVLVGTVHGWKGLQAKHVYVCMAGGVFPNFRSDQKAEEQTLAGEPVTAYDEERRLAYVAITRGMDSSTVISPHANYNGKPAITSRFIGEACIQTVGEAQQEQEEQLVETAKTASFSFGADLATAFEQGPVQFDLFGLEG